MFIVELEQDKQFFSVINDVVFFGKDELGDLFIEVIKSIFEIEIKFVDLIVIEVELVKNGDEEKIEIEVQNFEVVINGDLSKSYENVLFLINELNEIN